MTGQPAQLSVSVILPCLDEEESIAASVLEALDGLDRAELDGEVLVVDNGSRDRSVELALGAGARVVCEPRPGYGAALRRGITEARGTIGVMADADLTYELSSLGLLVARIENGSDLVFANRLDGVNGGTMPVLHRIIGTPVLSFVVRRLTSGKVTVRDSQSGFRAFKVENIRRLKLRTTGMEFASEMLVRAANEGWQIDEIQLPYRKRTGSSKLNTFDDGMRHIKVLTLLAPKLALLWPGLAAAAVGVLLTIGSLAQPSGLEVGGGRWQPVFFAPIALVIASLLLVSYTVLMAVSPLTERRSTQAHSRLRRRVVVVGLGLAGAGAAIDGILFVQFVAGGSEWDRSLAMAGLAQALMLSGAIWITSALLYWLFQRQSEYGAG